MLPLLLLYPLYVGVMYVRQSEILFPAASDEHYALKAALPADGQLVEIPASFGKLRSVLLMPHDFDKGTVVLYFHGNYECIESSFEVLQPLVAAKVAVLQVEFPGFCGADGKPTFAAIAESAKLAFDWLAHEPRFDRDRIVAMGYSMGGGVAAQLTTERPVHALALLSTYTSIEAMVHHYALPGFIVKYPYDTLARVREFQRPVFVEHGRHDEVIPFAMGEELAKAARGSRFLALDCGHASCRFDLTVFAEALPAWLSAQETASHSRD